MQFVVSGYYGFGNAGDEAVLAGMREAFALRAGDRIRLTALARNPEETTRLHGIDAVDRMNLSAMRQAIRESDLLISGGGSLLQDTTSVRSLLYYLWVARLALSQGVPVMFYAQGIGPLRRAMSRSLVKMVANRAVTITVRDMSSARLLQAIGVTRTPIEVTADPAFALNPAPPEIVDEAFRAEGLKTDAPLIGVALRAWGGSGESPVVAYARLLQALSVQTGARVALLPMQTPHDVTFAEQVAQATDTPSAYPIFGRAYPPSLLLGLIGKMEAVVAMRLHALIFAARMNVPLFALSYDPKVANLMKGLGLEDSLEHWRGFDPDEVSERVALLLAEREARVAALQTRTAERERLALRNADCALSLFDRNDYLRNMLTLAR